MSLQKIKALFGDIVAQDREITRKISEATGKIEALRKAPLSRADYIKNGIDTLDALAKGYLNSLQHQVDNDLKREPLDFVSPEGWFSGFCNGADVTKIQPSAAAALFGDLIKENYAKAISLLQWPKNCGPALADRMKQIVALEQEVVSLYSEQADLRQAAVDAGLSIGLFAVNPYSMTKYQKAAHAKALSDEASGKKVIKFGA